MFCDFELEMLMSRITTPLNHLTGRSKHSCLSSYPHLTPSGRRKKSHTLLSSSMSLTISTDLGCKSFLKLPGIPLSSVLDSELRD